MARTDDEVVGILMKLYKEEFGGKANHRYLISWADLRGIYGFDKLFSSRFEQLKEAASKRRLYLWDLGYGENGYFIGVIKASTVDRWRRVPKKIAEEYKISTSDADDPSEDDDE